MKIKIPYLGIIVVHSTLEFLFRNGVGFRSFLPNMFVTNDISDKGMSSWPWEASQLYRHPGSGQFRYLNYPRQAIPNELILTGYKLSDLNLRYGYPKRSFQIFRDQSGTIW